MHRASRACRRARLRSSVEGASLHNLRDVDVRFPLGRLMVVTGVSGSGKSTLARDVLHANLQRARRPSATADAARHAGSAAPASTACEQLARVLEVDQTPIGKTPRSCPATYVGFWDDDPARSSPTPPRRASAATAASRFSFNTAGGRCDACEGQGMRTIEMSFLPDVKVLCDGLQRPALQRRDACGRSMRGKQRRRPARDERRRGASRSSPRIRASTIALQLLQDVGLGYLTLGQQSPTLSGGEAQRIKLVTELAKVRGRGARDRARRRRSTRSTCSTSRPSACTWPTSRS